MVERCDYTSEQEFQAALEHEAEHGEREWHEQEQCELEYQNLLAQLENAAFSIGIDDAISFLKALKENNPPMVPETRGEDELPF